MIYIILNKPAGYGLPKDQFQRPTVVDLVNIPENFSCGQTDYDTSGSILKRWKSYIQLTHPKFKIKKVYRAVIKGIS